ncbi:MAG: tetratricopeptide repeat protein, partial [Terriglobia bacterium]
MVLGFAVLLLFLSVPVFAATSIETLHEQAEAAEAKGDLSTAIAKYRQILKLNPQLAPAYNNLGALYFKQGNFPKAAGVLKRALKVDPRMRSASVLLGMSLLQMSEYK